MNYRAIFIDIDDTLLDYVPCCREAYDAAISQLDAVYHTQYAESDYFQLFFDIAGRLFSEAKHGKYSISEVMDLYPKEFMERVNVLTGETMNDKELAQCTDTFKHAFRAAWGKTHALVPEAEPMLQRLRKAGYRLFAASNSFGHLQRSRLEQAGILNYFEDLFISMDIGYDKPDVRFFEEALRRANLLPNEVLMIGDSMTTDILGAQNAGIEALFFDRRNNASLLELIKPLCEFEYV